MKESMEYEHEKACFEYGRQQGKKEAIDRVYEIIKNLNHEVLLKREVISILEA